MASPAAQRYFDSFPPGQQAQIMASWGGADLMDQWFQNAVQSGAVSPDGQRPTSAGATSPTASTGNWTAAQLRDYAGQQGWSEDFQRFNDATLQGWINDYWDPQAMKFRSMRGAEGFFEKPTECPPGTMPGGPNESDGCIPNGSAPGADGGAGGGGRAGQGAQFGGFSSPLVDMLRNQGNIMGGYDPVRGDNNPGVQGGVLKGGGLWWSPTAQVTNAPGTAPAGPKGTGGPIASGPTSPGGFIPGMNLPGQPVKGAPMPTGQPRPGGFIPPVVGQGTGPASSTMRGGAIPGGQTSPGGWFPRQDALTAALAPLQGQQMQGPLTGMMAKQQRVKRPGAWF